MADSDEIAPLLFIATSTGHRRIASASAELDPNRSKQNTAASASTAADSSAEDDTVSAPTPPEWTQLPGSQSSSSLTQKRLKQQGPSYPGLNKMTSIRDTWGYEVNEGPNKLGGPVLEKTNALEPEGSAKKPKARKNPGVVPSVVTLGYSEIYQINTSPCDPESKLESTSPVSLGPQESKFSQTSRVTSPQPSPPAEELLPKDMSAFEYAMRPYLDKNVVFEHHLQLPARAQQEITTGTSSPLLPSARDEEISYSTSVQDAAEDDVSEDGISSDVKRMDPFKTRLKQTELRLHLMRCSVLQSAVREIEREPWAQNSKQPPYWYYSKMRNLAQKARQLAEWLQSNDLRARCEYWCGRGCGGTRDYAAAELHFKQAVKLDVLNDKYPSGRSRLRGLRPAEKADVKFLLDSVADRNENFRMRLYYATWHAQHESEKDNKPVEAFIDCGSDSPMWVPDRDRAIQIAHKDFGIRQKLGTLVLYPGDLKLHQVDLDLENALLAHRVAEGVEDENKIRRTLDAEEMKYIEHGDLKEAGKRRRRDYHTRRENSRLILPGRPASSIGIKSGDGESEKPDSSDSPHQPARKTDPQHTQPVSLEDELGGLDWNSDQDEFEKEASLPHTSSPAPTLGLNIRRKVGMPPVKTEGIRKGNNLDSAVLVDDEDDEEGEMVDVNLWSGKQ